jgi:hypothetical protein
MMHAALISLVLVLVPAGERTPEAVLAELATVNFPKVDSSRSRDADYMKGIEAERIRVGLERDRLILELYELDPGQIGRAHV